MRDLQSSVRSDALRALLVALLVAAGIPLSGRPVAAQELRGLFQQVKPSVVVIRTEEAIEPDEEGSEISEEGLASGVLISGDGKILTAAHVVQTAEKVEVQFADGTEAPAKIVSSVPSADVALIQVDRVSPSAHTVTLGDSDPVQVGDRVFVVGAPFELSSTLTVGYISGRRAPKSIKSSLSSELFQTDAAINKGSSGGPMFNMNGEIIGICTAFLSQSGGFAGVGFAVTSNFARKVILDSPATWTGIDGLYVDGRLREVLNVPQRAGVLVQRIARNSPAAALGLQGGRYRSKVNDEEVVLGGDIILSVNGISVEEPAAAEEIDRSLGQAKAGDRIRATILRAGKIVNLEQKMVAGTQSPK